MPAVQHLIADMAAETSLAKAATAAAVHEGRTPFTVAVAKIMRRPRGGNGRPERSPSPQRDRNHLEHPLHRRTLRVLAWRSEFGSVHHWTTTSQQRP